MLAAWGDALADPLLEGRYRPSSPHPPHELPALFQRSGHLSSFAVLATDRGKQARTPLPHQIH